MSMSMERRGESYNNGGSTGTRSYGTNNSYGGQDDEPYQIKRYESSKANSWGFGTEDPELKRRKRVASYKVYTAEGRVKLTVRNSWRWIKHKYIDLRYGWW